MSDNDKQPLNSSPETNNNPAPPPVAVPPPVPPTPPPAAAPPPPTPPPRCPLMPQQPMPRKSRFGKAGCLLWLIVLVFIATLVTQVTMGLIGIAASVVKKMDLSSGSSLAKAAPKIVTEVIRPGDSSEIIAVIAVNGVITSSDNSYHTANARRICYELRCAREDDSVVAIIIDMNTPGGEVTASDEILNEVRKCRAADKPVVTCMRALGASGGYFVASGSDWIIANRHTFTGSIGVIMSTLNYTELLDKVGVQAEVYRSGAMKDMLSGSRPRSELEKTYAQELILKTFSEFAQVVADGRSKVFADVNAVKAAGFADGRILTGAGALQEGLVDQLGYFDDAIVKAGELSGAIDPAVVSYSRRSSFFDALMSMKQSDALGLRQFAPVRGVSIEPGKPYFLAPEFL
ncbi:MAG: signal peptide peptidase SppA [Lentisphaeria bacterium]